jgi:ribonuclease Z
MKLTMLGTGNALVTDCYNTCFTLDDNGQILLVDGGGGNTLFHQLKVAGIDWRDVKDIFVTHKHVDHVMGIVWMIRMITQYMMHGEYDGEARIYAHRELCDMLLIISDMLLQKVAVKFIGFRLHIIAVEDGEERQIIGHKTTFFDISSTKAKQFGFTMMIDGENRLTCCGDETFNTSYQQYAEDSTWLMHEAFCLYSQADVFHPYEKHHSTVKDACAIAEKLRAKNLILYHTEDKNILKRKQLYTAEGAEYFHGNLFVPDDLETIMI